MLTVIDIEPQTDFFSTYASCIYYKKKISGYAHRVLFMNMSENIIDLLGQGKVLAY